MKALRSPGTDQSLFERTTRLTAPVRPIDLLAVISPKKFTKDVAKIRSIETLTPTSAQLTVSTPIGWKSHTAGQFVVLGVEIDGVRHSRCFSVTSIPTKRDDTIEIAVQTNPDGFVSRHLVEDARVGDRVFVTNVAGDFTLNSAQTSAVAIVTGGSGVTPAIGMLRDNAAREEPMEIFMIHHAPTLAETMYLGVLQELAYEHDWLTLELVFTKEGGTKVEIERLNSLCPDWRDRDLFVCGPATLIEYMERLAAAQGCLDNLHLERFKPADTKSESGFGSETSSVEMLRTNTIVEVPTGATILESIEASGSQPPAGCRMGICHTCTTKLVSGCATDIRDGSKIVEGAHVQICVSTATEDLTLDL